MIIDAHTHLHKSHMVASAESLLEVMDRAGVDKAAIFPSPGSDFTTEETIETARAHPDRFFAIGTVAPLTAPADALQRLHAHLETGAVRGLKFFLGYQYFYPNDLALLTPYMRLAESANIPVIFHTGDTVGFMHKARLKFAHPLAIDDLAVEFPNVKIVIAHMGNPWMMDAAAVMQKNPNVFADISGWIYGNLSEDDRVHLTTRFLEAYWYVGDATKFLFGSDFPISDPVTYVAFVKGLRIPTEDKEAIFSKNALRIFGLT